MLTLLGKAAWLGFRMMVKSWVTDAEARNTLRAHYQKKIPDLDLEMRAAREMLQLMDDIETKLATMTAEEQNKLPEKMDNMTDQEFQTFFKSLKN